MVKIQEWTTKHLNSSDVYESTESNVEYYEEFPHVSPKTLIPNSAVGKLQVIRYA